jgi:hypothetical protein
LSRLAEARSTQGGIEAKLPTARSECAILLLDLPRSFPRRGYEPAAFYDSILAEQRDGSMVRFGGL